MEWQQFVMNLESVEADCAEAALLRAGAQSVTLSDAGNAPVLEPLPGETPLWPETRITALFDSHIGLEEIRQTLMADLALTQLPPNHLERLENRDWEREWLRDFHPMRFGQRLWIVPGDTAIPAEAEVVVRLDPGLAFGTGTHPTTALCLEWLDATEIQNQIVLDYGCGSGILSIAACKLGAKRVFGIDIDRQAVTASHQNAIRNDVRERFDAALDLEDDRLHYDVVLANILAGTLIDHASKICALTAPGGKIALSGILEEQIDSVMSAYRDLVHFSAPVLRDNWALLTGTRF